MSYITEQVIREMGDIINQAVQCGERQVELRKDLAGDLKEKDKAVTAYSELLHAEQGKTKELTAEAVEAENNIHNLEYKIKLLHEQIESFTDGSKSKYTALRKHVKEYSGSGAKSLSTFDTAQKKASHAKK